MVNQSKQSGFVALFSSIIISFVLLLVAITLNFNGFYGRTNVLESEYKETADRIADACVEELRLLLVANPSLSGSGTINTAVGTCNYTLSNSTGVVTAFVSVIHKNAHAYIKVILDANASKVPLIYAEELKNYP